MKGTEFFIKRPVFSMSLSLLIVLAGLFSFFHLPLRMFPKVEVPVVTISVNYPGASAETMQNFVTKVVQNGLAGIENVNYITATSGQGYSKVHVHMNLGANADTALMNIMQKVASVRDDLPEGIRDPVIYKNTDDDDVLTLAFTSQSMSSAQVNDYINRVIRPQIEGVEGVSSLNVFSSQLAMKIQLNAAAMSAMGITTQDMINALKAQNIQAAPGSIEGQNVHFNVTADSGLDTAKQFQSIVLKTQQGRQVRLGDIAQVKWQEDSDDITAYYKGVPAVMGFLRIEPGANPLKVVSNVQNLLPSIQAHMQGDIKIHSVFDSAVYIKASIEEVIIALLEAILIVSIVTFLFTGSLRTVLIPIIAIPISLIGICFFLWVLNCSINMLTLLALVLAIGLVVDDAIVVMENIFRHLEAGEPPFRAAIKGSREIAFSIIAMTLTLTAIFVPIAFSGGLTGKLFSEFAFSLAGTVIISGFVALTLSPMMCAKILNEGILTHDFAGRIERIFMKVKSLYARALTAVFNYRYYLIALWALSFLGCFYFYTTTKQELAPKEDIGFIRVIGSAPNTVNSHFIKAHTNTLNSLFRSFPEVESYLYINSIPEANQFLGFAKLTPWNKRSLSSFDLQNQLQSALQGMASFDSVAIVPSVLPGTWGYPIQFVIKSQTDFKTLYDESQTLLQMAKKSGLFLFINTDLNYDKPALKLQIDRDAAAALHVDVGSIMSVLGTLLSGGRAQYFSKAGEVYKVIPQIDSQFSLNPSSLKTIHVRNQDGELIPLSGLVTLKTEVEASSLNQFQKFNAVTFSGVMVKEHTVSEGLNFLMETVKAKLPSDVLYDFAGNSRQFIQEGNRMLWLFLSAFIVIFIILAMQFESFKDPLIILFGSVPMTLLAAMLPLKLGFSTINIYTQIGLLTLVGLVSKHGILITKFANTLMEGGLDAKAAVIKAASIRLRPILMTTAAMVFGAMPLLFGKGASSVSRFDLGSVICVGMFFGTLFTLFILPVLYYFSHLLDKK